MQPPLSFEHALRVGDVVRLHRELADPVGGTERGRASLHREPLGVVGDRLSPRVEDRVVVTAPQLDRHLAGDDRRDPPLQRVAQHQRLGVEPAALVEQPPELAPVDGVLLEGRLVVDRGQQPFVRDVQERHPWRFVDAAALRLDDAILDLVGHAETVAAADLVHLADHRDRIADGQPVLEADRHDLRLDLGLPEADAHDRLDDLHARREELEILRLVRRAEHVRVGRVRLLGRGAMGEAPGGEPLAHLLPPTKLCDERFVEPGFVDAERGVRE